MRELTIAPSEHGGGGEPQGVPGPFHIKKGESVYMKLLFKQGGGG